MFQAHKKPILFTRTTRSLGKILLVRVLVVFGVLFAVFLSFLLHRSGIEDSHGNNPGIIDLIYFTVITVTTVGYGDIVPVSAFAKLFDAFAVTVARFTVWIIVLRTTYELVLQKYLEAFKMKSLKKRLKNHVIVCGFGELGRAATEELMEKGFDKQQIVVLDSDPERSQEAADTDVAALCSDATRELSLSQADIKDAKYLIASAGRDDTNVLICLTARSMNPQLIIVCRVVENENVKLMKSSGANSVISPTKMAGTEIARVIHAPLAETTDSGTAETP
jgi:voltage-gated potassium channel